MSKLGYKQRPDKTNVCRCEDYERSAFIHKHQFGHSTHDYRSFITTSKCVVSRCRTSLAHNELYTIVIRDADLSPGCPTLGGVHCLASVRLDHYNNQHNRRTMKQTEITSSLLCTRVFTVTSFKERCVCFV